MDLCVVRHEEEAFPDSNRPPVAERVVLFSCRLRVPPFWEKEPAMSRIELPSRSIADEEAERSSVFVIVEPDSSVRWPVPIAMPEVARRPFLMISEESPSTASLPMLPNLMDSSVPPSNVIWWPEVICVLVMEKELD